MAWSPDPELHQMFLDELDQRSGRLSTGARAMADGDPGSIDVPAMRREGHTIKGTARVMGYEAIGLVALMIEEIWDAVAAGELEPTADMGEALAAVCVELELAGRESPQHGTLGLAEAVAALHDAAPSVGAPEITPAHPEEHESPTSETPAAAQAPERPAPPHEPSSPPVPDAAIDVSDATIDEAEVIEDVEVLPPSAIVPADHSSLFSSGTENHGSASRREAGKRSDTLPVSTGPQHTKPVSRREPLDLRVEYGGVIEAVEEWAGEGTVIVNAGRLYRLINRIAATRAEASALAKELGTGSFAGPGVRDKAERMAAAAAALQGDVLGLASLPLATLTSTLPQLVKYLSKKLGKNVELEVTGDAGVVIDRHVLETISEPVRQLIVNALYHGLEIPTKRKTERKPGVGSVTLDVALDGNMVELVVADDGAGVDWSEVRRAGIDLGLIEESSPHEPADLTPLLFEPGFTTGAIEGGRGDGLARLAAAIEALHGRVHFETWSGDGTRVTIRVPAWQALHRVSIVSAGGLRWAIPEAAVGRSLSIAEAGLEAVREMAQIEVGNDTVPLLPFVAAAGMESSGDEATLVVLSHRVGSAAFAVDSVEGGFDVAVTELAQIGSGPEHVTGVALLPGGEVAFVVDVGELIQRVRVVPGESRSRSRVLLADLTAGGRAEFSGSLSSSGFSTSVAETVAEALDVLAELAVDALVVEAALPGAGGVALVEEVRRRDRALPIVMIASDASEEDKIRAKKAGVDRFFDKSEGPEGALVTALWELIEG